METVEDVAEMIEDLGNEKTGAYARVILLMSRNRRRLSRRPGSSEKTGWLLELETAEGPSYVSTIPILDHFNCVIVALSP